MHRRLRAAPFFPLLLLLLLVMHCAGGCRAAAGRRVFDDTVPKSGRPAAAVVREVPRRGQGAAQAYTVAAAAAAGGTSSEGWAPIRIEVSTEDLKDETKYCRADGEKKPDFKGNNEVCAEQYVLTEERKSALVNAVIPVAVKLHAERLLVQRVQGLLQVPKFPGTRGRCQHFTVPK
ncbi:surface protease GP63 [Trypanosoma conorhini]|uniref:Leishmanolysin-like peptidase n=1 Tax=Trypanosoma conorhini TaxID=83891 RepID=A0A3R7R669_9TRYP|nr:surface protease GP63 [Trypanosoma conorhini]RNE96676.1 surface protease GP63 [Trypanosoma conorhini]